MKITCRDSRVEKEEEGMVGQLVDIGCENDKPAKPGFYFDKYVVSFTKF